MIRSCRWLVLALALVGCANRPQQLPASGSLTLREVLAMSPAVVAALSDAERGSLCDRLDAGVKAQASAGKLRPAAAGDVPAAPRHALELPVGFRLALALDDERRSGGQDAVLAASVDKTALAPLRVAALCEGSAVPEGGKVWRGKMRLQQVATRDPLLPDPDSSAPAPGSSVPASGSSVPASGSSAPDPGDAPGPGKTSLPAGLQVPDWLEARLRMALAGLSSLETELVVSQARGAPFALLYVPAASTLYVNPVALALAPDKEHRHWATHWKPPTYDGRVCKPSDAHCLAEAMTLTRVAACVKRTTPSCEAKNPKCAGLIRACVSDEVVHTACSPLRWGPLGRPCSAVGSSAGEMCGSACGGTCDEACLATGCPQAANDFWGNLCSCRECSGCRGNSCNACTPNCKGFCGDCGSDCGLASTGTCTDALRHGSECDAPACSAGGILWTPPPPPPLSASRPPPLRSVVGTAGRDLLAFMLPPLLCLFLSRRRRKQALAPEPGDATEVSS